MDDVPDGLDDGLARLDEALTVHAALDRLSPECHEILDRFFCRDESYRTIGAELELPSGTIASRIARCLARLRDVIDPARPRREETRVQRVGWTGGTAMTTPEERIAELLRALPAPPAGWAEAAKELPAVRRELDTILERIERDERLRERAVADLEAMLRAEGVEPTPVVVAHLRRRLEP